MKRKYQKRDGRENSNERMRVAIFKFAQRAMEESGWNPRRDYMTNQMRRWRRRTRTSIRQRFKARTKKLKK